MKLVNLQEGNSERHTQCHEQSFKENKRFDSHSRYDKDDAINENATNKNINTLVAHPPAMFTGMCHLRKITKTTERGGRGGGCQQR